MIGEGGWGSGTKGAFLNNALHVVKIGGRVLLVAGIVSDVYDTATSNNPVRTAAVHAGGWAGAWAFGQAGGAIGATIGSFIPIPGVGTAALGLVGGIIGGAIGYFAGAKAVDNVLE